MILGVYLKSKPRHEWHLVSVSISPEIASHDIKNVLEHAKMQGNDLAEAVIQSFDVGEHVPQIIHNIKEQKSLYN